jgi:hypothetical protein
VNERGGLEGVVRALLSHVAMRQAMQFRVDERDQAVERGRRTSEGGRYSDAVETSAAQEVWRRVWDGMRETRTTRGVQ